MIAALAALALAASAPPVVDRTFLCTTSIGHVTTVASPRGTSEVAGARFTSSGYARVTSGPNADPLADLVVVARPGFRNASTRFPGAVYASGRRCTALRAAVPLASTGLPGPPVAFRSDAECTVRGSVVVHVRAVLAAGAAWGRLRGPVGAAFVGARGRVVEAELAVRDQATGRPLAFAKLGRAGRSQLWSSPRCL